MRTGCAWGGSEQAFHINSKEMLAVYYASRSFKSHLLHTHTRVLCDNTTAVSVINKMGTSHSDDCNTIAQHILSFCQEHSIRITCSYLPGVENVTADFESRKDYKQANRLNAQLDSYVSFKPDPYATAIDAFSLNWSFYKCYVFPPFNVIYKVLQKIRVDKAMVLCVFPEWPTQPWWPFLQRMTIRKPMHIKPSPTNLVLTNKPQELHPFHQKLSLIACLLSGDTITPKAYIETL